MHSTNRGNDFRPAYKEVAILRSFIPVTVLLCTATCTKSVRDDLLQALNFEEADIETVALIPDRLDGTVIPT